jgi:hypothetical protein
MHRLCHHKHQHRLSEERLKTLSELMLYPLPHKIYLDKFYACVCLLVCACCVCTQLVPLNQNKQTSEQVRFLNVVVTFPSPWYVWQLPVQCTFLPVGKVQQYELQDPHLLRNWQGLSFNTTERLKGGNYKVSTITCSFFQRRKMR